MASKKFTAKGRRKGGSFIALPHAVLEHESFYRLSHRAARMLLTLFAQYNGANNGDFTAAYRVIKHKGWRSNDQIYKALDELINTGWIIKTRQGHRPNKASLYAVSFLPIHECNGKLDISATRTALGYWKLGNDPTQ